MAIQIVSLNGESSLLNYEVMEEALKQFTGSKCTEATLYVFNNFPVTVTTESDIDLLLIFSLDKKSGSYIRYRTNGVWANFKNFILPITVRSQFKQSTISTQNNDIYIDGNEYDAIEELRAVKFGLLNFLTKEVGLVRVKLHFEPAMMILNDSIKTTQNNIMVGQNIDPYQLIQLIQSNSNHYANSYSEWGDNMGYIQFKGKIQEITERASVYSTYGYLTRRKIDRIDRSLLKKYATYDSLGVQTTIISGKAGTGKTSQLMHLLIRSMQAGNDILFLTYNQLLTKDIAFQVKRIKDVLYVQWEKEKKEVERFSKANVQTLMGFIYQLGKKLGVIHIMSESRLQELEEKLLFRLDNLRNQMPLLIDENRDKIFGFRVDFSNAIEAVQNSQWPVDEKQEGIGLIKFIQRNNFSLTYALSDTYEAYFQEKYHLLQDITIQKVFLQDYIGVLKNILDVINNTEEFYTKFQVRNRFELLDALFDLSTRKPDADLLDGFISLDLFSKRIKRVVAQRNLNNRLLFIDEAQDCHPYEREIFYNIFSTKNVVVSNGGKEQLMRFANICDWTIFNMQGIPNKAFPTGNKSYRIKQNILHFCNFLAESYNIKLNLEPFSSEDPGMIVFDFSKYTETKFSKIFPRLLTRGEAMGCTPQESLMVLDVNPKDDPSNHENERTKSERVGKINEFDVIKEDVDTEKKPFHYLGELASHAEYWNGADPDNKRGSFPSPNEVRVLNYNSCRGLEAWSVMCLNLDKFFFAKTKDEDADDFLLNENTFMTREQRAATYAITGVLMAATRAIDLIYIQLNHEGNEFVEKCKEFVKKNPTVCKVINTV
ncbi:hypothetical protein BH10BAC3_BH10BAC3_16150 [soil metagenome]